MRGFLVACCVALVWLAVYSWWHLERGADAARDKERGRR